MRFLNEDFECSIGELWARGAAMATWCSRNECERLAVILSNTSGAVACVLGAIQSGLELISLPLPPRGVAIDWYQHFIVRCCRTMDANVLMVDEFLASMMPPLPGIRTVSYQQALSERGRLERACADAFTLVQFTSGSTSEPKGVPLRQEKILANILAILEILSPERSDSATSWLPLSHDMGLIGMFLTSCVGVAPKYANGGSLNLLSPEAFLRHPALWLQACSDLSTTITASPDFGFGLALRRRPSASLDLSKLRCCITGAEPVQHDTLVTFASEFESAGFRGQSFCPAYGLAEAGLAVTMTSPVEEWRAITVDPDALSAGAVVGADGGLPFVSAGRPLPGYEINVGSRVEPLKIRGPSLLERYVGTQSVIDDKGWFETGDLAFSLDGHLYLVGRHDDVIIHNGRNVFSQDVTAAVQKSQEVRTGRVAVMVHDGSIVIYAELEAEVEESPLRFPILAKAIRRSILGRTQIQVAKVTFLRRGSLPMTSSGKVSRHHLANAEDAELAGSVIYSAD